MASRRHAEAALRKEKEKAERYLDIAGVIIVALHREGTVTLINRKGCETLGYASHQIIETPWFETYVAESDRERAKAKFLRMVRGEESVAVCLNNPVPTRSGEHRSIAWHNNLLTDEEGAIIGTLSSGEDVTERNRAEEALRQSEEQFQLFMQHFPGLAYIKDANGRVLFANNGFAEYFGFDPSTMVGKTNHDLFPASFAEKITADDLMVLQSGERYQIEESYDEHVWSTHKFPIPRAGEQSLLGGFTLDITEKKKTEEALRQTEEMLTRALEGANLGIWAWDLTTGKGTWTDMTHRMLGYEPNEFEANLKNWKRLVHPDDWPKVSENLNLHIAGKLPMFETEYRMMNKSNEWQWVQARGKVVELDRDGRPIRMIGIVVDVTERKQAEQQLKASLKEKEVLLREIHHRVKNNLAVVSSLLRLQGRQARSAQAAETFEDIQNRIRSMALAHELLYQSDNLADIRLRSYVGKLINQFTNSLSSVGRGIQIITELQDVVLGIDTAIPLGFILTELVSNCLKHAFPAEGGGEIRVSFRQITDGELELAVKDDGVEMAAGMVDEPPTSMGLELVKIFVTQLNGNMEILREKGTEVRIRFRGR